MRFFSKIGSRIRSGIAKVGQTSYDFVALLFNAIRHTPYMFRRGSLFWRQLHEVGNRSLFIVVVLGAFIGMILALQSGYQLRKFNQEGQIGLIGFAIIKEFGPVITAFLLAGRIGSAYAAEIGTMVVYEEVDALKVIGVNPVAYLATPRLWACLIMVPLLTIYADFVAMLGGALVAQTYVGVPPSKFFDVFFDFMEMKEFWRSMVKSLFFGAEISLIGCFIGFRTRGGAEGVGRSTTTSVVYSILAILISDYFIEKVLLAAGTGKAL